MGSASGGIWTSDNDGTTWTPRTDQAPSLAIGAVADDPTNPDHLIAGTGEANQCADCFFSAGILSSVDGGTTWTVQNPGSVFLGRHVAQVAIDPSNSMHQFAATDGGLYVTSDGGTTWAKPTDASYPPVDGLITAVVFSPATPATVYLGGGAATVAKSTDGGVTWAPADTGITNPPAGTSPTTAIAIAKTNPMILYASVGARGNAVILYKSTDGGAHWSILTNTPDYTGQGYSYGTGSDEQGWFDNVLAVDPLNANHLFAGGIALVESTDGGATLSGWSNVNGQTFFGLGTNLIHPDQHALAFRPDGKLWVGDDGGLFLYSPTGHSVANANGNLNITQFYFGFNEVGGSVLAGAQDNGSAITSSPTVAAWTGIFSGDGGPSAITANHTQTQFISANQHLYRTTDAFASVFDDITPPASGAFTSPMIVVANAGDPANPTVLYGGPDVYRTTNPSSPAPTWTKVTSMGGGGVFVSALAASTTNPAVIYAGFDDGTIAVSTDGGLTFSALAAQPFAVTFVTGLSVDPTNPKSVTASVSTSDVRAFVAQPHVAQYTYSMTPGSGTWTVVTGNLPANKAVSRVVYYNQALLAATDSGVYGTSGPAGAATTWSVVGSGLPAVQVQDLFLDETSGDLFALTHGRGAWKLPKPPPAAPVFTADTPPGAATVGVPYSYTYAATGNPTPTYAVASGSLPPGLSLNATTGALSGTPTAAGAFSFAVKATNGVAPDAVSPTATIAVPSPAPADFDGDGKTDVSVFRPSSGGWFVQGRPPVFFGLSGDIPVPCDYAGTGKSQIAVFRPSVGGWYIQGQAPVFFGLSGDIPVPGDYTGAGHCTIAVFRPSVGGWYIQGQAPVFFGLSGDIPVPGRYSSAAATQVAVFRPSAGGWYIRGQAPVFFGLSSDIPVPANYAGTATTNIAVFRPSVGGWYRNGAATVFLGAGGDVPVAGEYSTVGTSDAAVFRPATGAWYVNGQPPVSFGLNGDIPLPIPAAVREAIPYP